MNIFLTNLIFSIRLLYSSGTIGLILALLIGIYSICLLLSSCIITGYIKFFIDVGCASMYVCQLIFIFFLLIPILHTFMTSSWPLWIFSTHCSRRSFFIGLYITSLAALYLISLTNFFASIILCWSQTGKWVLYIWPLFGSTLLHGIFLVSTAFFASCFVSRAAHYLIVAGIYCIAYTNQTGYSITHTNYPFLKSLLLFARSYVIPDMHLIDIQSETIYEQAISYRSFFLAAFYILLFSLAQLILGVYLFEKKEW